MSNKFLYHVGIDPAWKNLGLAIVKEDVETGELHLVHSCVMNPSTFSSIPAFVDKLWETVLESLVSSNEEPNISSVTIERFVAYAGVSTAETENICMVIGALQYLFGNSDLLLLRAIDWKTGLVKALYKTKGFENPSTSLDKKFSDAAAECCLNLKPKSLKTNHESDAVCLASYRTILKAKK
jgi:hypothetical protein